MVSADADLKSPVPNSASDELRRKCLLSINVLCAVKTLIANLLSFLQFSSLYLLRYYHFFTACNYFTESVSRCCALNHLLGISSLAASK